MLFGKDWFFKHQKILLLLTNTLIGRYILRIHGDKSSVGKNKIVRIERNAIYWRGKKPDEFVVEVRTHPKFAKRILYTFYPIWYLIHLWDTLFANNFAPNLNLGFDTLTVYPDPN